MKWFLQLSVVVLTVVSIYLPNIVVADINITGHGNSGIKSPTFEQASNPSGMLSFEYNQSDGDASSLGTCAMNPMNNSSNDAILEEFPIVEPDTYTPVTSRASALVSDTPQDNNPYLPRYDIPRYSPPDPSGGGGGGVTPEPATLLMMGFGMVGLVPLMRRYRRK